ncbi:hypothetical protein [Burkholderia multivorans]|uniref:hypothetical protein n=1 Tax=Burkholderia multivorans TaxID=87883 RepID=UPI0004F5F9E5|nr:hypothetical protein [Burkholderia multivorans]AIO77015.1 hypothetical protein DM80_3047 [Burkholderia multivorans]
MSKRDDGQWVPLEEAATLVNRKASTLISQMRRRRLERDRHYRYIGDGKLELNVLEYLRWVDYEKAERKRPLVERMARQIARDEVEIKKVLDDIAQKPSQTSQPTSPSTKSKPKLIPLSVWVDQTFGEYPLPRTPSYDG